MFKYCDMLHSALHSSCIDSNDTRFLDHYIGPCGVAAMCRRKKVKWRVMGGPAFASCLINRPRNTAKNTPRPGFGAIIMWCFPCAFLWLACFKDHADEGASLCGARGGVVRNTLGAKEWVSEFGWNHAMVPSRIKGVSSTHNLITSDFLLVSSLFFLHKTISLGPHLLLEAPHMRRTHPLVAVWPC